MIAVDTNILIYAHRGESQFNEAAFECMRYLTEGTQPWGIPVGCVHEFLSVVTNPKLMKPPTTTSQSFAQLDAWLSAPTAQVLHTGPQHFETLATLASSAETQGGQFYDARIAATCIENGVAELWTADRDFGRFKALRTVNPLV